MTGCSRTTWSPQLWPSAGGSPLLRLLSDAARLLLWVLPCLQSCSCVIREPSRGIKLLRPLGRWLSPSPPAHGFRAPQQAEWGPASVLPMRPAWYRHRLMAVLSPGRGPGSPTVRPRGTRRPHSGWSSMGRRPREGSATGAACASRRSCSHQLSWPSASIAYPKRQESKRVAAPPCGEDIPRYQPMAAVVGHQAV